MASSTLGESLAVFRVQQGPLAGQQFPVTSSTVTIGRTAGSDIILNDSDVSRLHARLTWDGRQFTIEDLGSTNGTFVDGVRITGPQALNNGSTVKLGDLTLSFQSALVAGVAGGSAESTNVRTPAAQPPAQAYSPAARAPAAHRGGSTPWLMILGGGGLLFLFLVAVALAAVFFLRPSSSDPAVSITAPFSGSEVTVGDETTIIAVTNDDRGITHVELWVDGGLLNVKNSASSQGQTAFPVQFQWTPDEQGSHTLEIRAYNRDGRSNEPVSVQVSAVAGEPEPTETISVIVVAPTATGAPQVLPTIEDTPSTSAGACTPNSAFVADVTIPDYTEIQPGQLFEKIWRLRNSGTCAWDAGYQLVYVSGDLMNAALSHAVPGTPPGGTADIQATMYAPESPGTYRSVWRLKDSGGESFGASITVVIVVPAPDAPALPDAPAEVDTPDASGCAAAIDFRADRTAINRGESTTVRWDVECVREVYFQGGPVTGHESRDVSPESTTTYTLRVVKNDGSSTERQVTVEVIDGDAGDEPPFLDDVGIVEDDEGVAGFYNVDASYFGYDAGILVFRVTNSSTGDFSAQSVETRIRNFSSDEVYLYGWSNIPFRTNPLPGPSALSNLRPGESKYLVYTLEDDIGGVRCRATIKFFTGGGRTGQSVTKTVDFSPPGSSGGGRIGASITYHSYDASSGWVTFQIRNTGDVTIEGVRGHIVDQGSGAVYYGPSYSSTPFRNSATTQDLVDSLPPGSTKYLRYRLNGAPRGVNCTAYFRLDAANDQSGASTSATTNFRLP